MSIHRLVVPTDLSPSASVAVRYAADLAEAIRARVEVLHVCAPDCTQYRLSWTPAGPRVEAASNTDYASPHLERLAATLSARGLEARATLIEAPSVVEGILSRVVRTDLIVLASETDPSHPFNQDSISQSVAHAAPCPVLLVHATATAPLSGLHILVPTDLSEASAAALHIARELAAALGGTVDVVHALADGPEAATWGGEAVGADDEMPDARRLRYVERFVTSTGGKPVPLSLRFVEGPPVEALAGLAREASPDLIVVGQPTDRPEAPDRLLAALWDAAPCLTLRTPLPPPTCAP